ncbi:MAG TPA: dethiobiotin synthase [Nitrososphaeraceae archaeon]
MTSLSNKKLQGVFVTGTDTEIGKTTIASGLAWLLCRNKIKVGIMKPFATSSLIYSSHNNSQDTAVLAKAANIGEPDQILNPIFFPLSASPLMAAEILNKTVNLRAVTQKFNFLKKKYDFILVEGIGGIMVPITTRVSLQDIIRKMNLPIIIVSRPRLGSINHTILTINACKETKIPILGVIFNQMPKHPNIVESLTPKYIEKLTHIRTISIIPNMDKCNFKKIGSYLGKNAIIKNLISELIDKKSMN